MPRMKALKQHGWNQGKVHEGDEYEATEQEADLLTALQWAVRIDVNGTEPRKRRQYRRRDLTAQN